MPNPAMKQVHGEASFHLATPEVDLYVTARGGQMAPVVFHLAERDVSPYALAPWEPADHSDLPPLLSVLRGDFLCLPFGGQTHGPPHGETANAEWQLLAANERSLTLKITAADTGAHVIKTLESRPGHHAIYIEHEISNLEGDFNYGSHPIIDLSGLPDQSARISVSPFRWASTYPGQFSNPADGESQALAAGAEFNDLKSVPLAAGGLTDLSRYPSRAGHDDLVMMVSEPASVEQPFAWSAVVLNDYLWFSLKNPADFPSTLFWLSNGGRTAAPWNSKHIARLGIEEVCSHFADGVDVSRTNPLAHQKIPTCRKFHRDKKTSLRLIHATALNPGFGKITAIIPSGEQAVCVMGSTGLTAIVPLDWQFVVSKG